jgi:hypothetical protein
VPLDVVLKFHQTWFWVAVVSCGVVGAWGLVAGLMKRDPGRLFVDARSAAIATMLIQVSAGVYLYWRGLRPSSALHVFYGVVIVITLTLAYVYRATMARRPALTYGILLLFVMGLGLRAWANVG